MSEQNPESARDIDSPEPESPFHVVVRPQATPALQLSDDSEEEQFSLEDIEAAYLQALETADLAESLTREEFGDDEPEADCNEAVTESAFIEEPASVAEKTIEPAPQPSEQFDSREASEVSGTSEDSGGCEDETTDDPLVSSEQVVEAMLFVGGPPLPAKKFLDVLGGAHTQTQLDEMLESLSAKYVNQKRPYEIRLVEGGYCLQLSSGYESVRSRVYGHGPKEVKLGQEALEVLAFIAYQQPVGREAIFETGKENLPGLLRQLLRRELISLQRETPEIGDQYRTTPRFLELFGLTSTEDLPQVGTFNFK